MRANIFALLIFTPGVWPFWFTVLFLFFGILVFLSGFPSVFSIRYRLYCSPVLLAQKRQIAPSCCSYNFPCWQFSCCWICGRSRLFWSVRVHQPGLFTSWSNTRLSPSVPPGVSHNRNVLRDYSFWVMPSLEHIVVVALLILHWIFSVGIFMLCLPTFLVTFFTCCLLCGRRLWTPLKGAINIEKIAIGWGIFIS